MLDNVVLLQGTNQGHRRKERQRPFNTLINLTKKKNIFLTGTARGGGGVAPLNPPLNFGDYISIQNLIFICVLGSKMATLASECPTNFDFSSAKLLTKFIFEFLLYCYVDFRESFYSQHFVLSI